MIPDASVKYWQNTVDETKKLTEYKRDRQTETDRDRQRQTEKEREREREGERETDRQRQGENRDMFIGNSTSLITNVRIKTESCGNPFFSPHPSCHPS